MQIATYALFSLQIIGTLATPLYLSLRGKMSLSKKHHYSKKRILKDIAVHFLMMSFISAHFVIMIYSFLFSTSEASQRLLFYISLEIVLLGAALYGSGMYISSVIVDTVTKKNFTINNLIHGPISHGIMYGAYVGAFGNLANIASFTTTSAQTAPTMAFLVVGVLGGYSAGISAISSGISFLFSLITLAIGSVFIFHQTNFSNPFFIHFVGFFCTAFLISFTYPLASKKRRANLFLYKPINFSNLKL